MESGVSEGECVALIVPGEPAPGEAKRLVRRALERGGRAPWREMEIELYPGTGESLLIARPRRGEQVYIAPWALVWLAGRLGGS